MKTKDLVIGEVYAYGRPSDNRSDQLRPAQVLDSVPWSRTERRNENGHRYFQFRPDQGGRGFGASKTGIYRARGVLALVCHHGGKSEELPALNADTIKVIRVELEANYEPRDLPAGYSVEVVMPVQIWRTWVDYEARLTAKKEELAKTREAWAVRDRERSAARSRVIGLVGKEAIEGLAYTGRRDISLSWEQLEQLLSTAMERGAQAEARASLSFANLMARDPIQPAAFDGHYEET